MKIMRNTVKSSCYLSFLSAQVMAGLFAFLLGASMGANAATKPLSYGSLIPPNANCHGINLVSVVAHMDDDLLFIDPGISEVLVQGGCATTIFMVGGSSGAGFDYVLRREAASKKAYARMI
ncbi:MAG TPA: hypothetical protein VFH31_02975, partial [Pyrinomonadaceae bacterium]|nr:hypothetical protein [Pyrinomonadaceae bacterium]